MPPFLSERGDLSESLRTHDQPDRASSKLWQAGLLPSPSLEMTSPPISSSPLVGRSWEAATRVSSLLLSMASCKERKYEIWKSWPSSQPVIKFLKNIYIAKLLKGLWWCEPSRSVLIRRSSRKEMTTEGRLSHPGHLAILKTVLRMKKQACFLASVVSHL